MQQEVDASPELSHECLLRQAENRLDRSGRLLVLVELALELTLAGGGQAVETNAAARLRRAPLGSHPAFHEDSLQRRIQRSFFRFQDLARKLSDALCDRIPMKRTAAQDAKDQHRQCALRHRN